MKPTLLKIGEVFCILPATLSVTFALGIIATALPSLANRAVSFAQVGLTAAIAVCVLMGTVASWITIFGDARRLDAKPNFKRKLQIALALGVIGGVGFVASVGGFTVDAPDVFPSKSQLIAFWAAFSAPSILLMAAQFIGLTRRTKTEK